MSSGSPEEMQVFKFSGDDRLFQEWVASIYTGVYNG